MSRVGKLPISIPQGVSVSLDDKVLTVKGPKGALARAVHPQIDVTVEDGTILVTRRDDEGPSRALHGLTRALLFNLVHGVTQGFTKTLEITGTGYRAEAVGTVLNLSLGFSHPVQFVLPQGITAAVEKQTSIRLDGIDKEVLGQTAARIRAIRPVEPYKGKGVRYSDEVVHRKVGKTGSKK